jgi:predicted Zn-dependent peptidase
MIIVENNGGEANGNTTNDPDAHTSKLLPSNQIDLGLYIEADRMRRTGHQSRANLDNQRKTVQEERRERYDNQPYGKTFEAVIDLAYDNFAAQAFHNQVPWRISKRFGQGCDGLLSHLLRSQQRQNS